MKTLSRTQWGLARRWLFTHGRSLEQKFYEFLFEGGPAAAVVAALVEYRNVDGGFGHGLEPDIRTPASSVVATTMAFRLLRRMGIGPDEPLVQRGIGYFVATYDAAGGRWPIVPAAVEAAPHAPWWTYATIEQTFSGFALNPTAEVVGYLIDYAELIPAELRAAASRVVLERLTTPRVPVSQEALSCLLMLGETRGLDSAMRRAVDTRIAEVIPTVVVQDPARWHEYCFTPLDVAPAPATRFVALLDRHVIDAQLDHWIDTLSDDGAWSLPWSWAQIDAAAWTQAEAAWQGWRIVERLATLAAYGRVAP